MVEFEIAWVSLYKNYVLANTILYLTSLLYPLEESHEEAKSTILKLMKVLINPVDAGTACDTSVLLQEIKTCQEIMEGIATNQDDSTSMCVKM